MTEVIYREAMQSVYKLLAGIQFGEPTFLFGGIVINADDAKPSSICLRHAVQLEDGRFTDWTSDFREKSEAQFKALEAGKLDVFR